MLTLDAKNLVQETFTIEISMDKTEFLVEDHIVMKVIIDALKNVDGIHHIDIH